MFVIVASIISLGGAMSNFFKQLAARPVPMRTNTPPRKDVYLRNDPIPVPDVIEDDPETSWAMWAEAIAIQDEFYSQTAPAPMTNEIPARMQRGFNSP